MEHLLGSWESTNPNGPQSIVMDNKLKLSVLHTPTIKQEETEVKIPPEPCGH